MFVVCLTVGNVVLASCGTGEGRPSTTAEGPSTTAGRDAKEVDVGDTRFFGFVGVDCYFDDPLDAEPRIDYVNEVGGFTNIAHTCAAGPDDQLGARLDALHEHGIAALLDVSPVLFETVADTSRPSGLRSTLLPDAKERWATFTSTNADVLDAERVAAIYPIDEPTRNGVSAQQLAAAVALIESTHPSIPIAVVEAYTDIEDLVVPVEVDWVGFDRFFVADPESDEQWLSNLASIKAARSRSDQRVALVLDASYTDAHRAAGMSPGDLRAVGESLVRIAASDPDVIAIIGFLWPGGLDEPAQLGARELPVEVREFYRAVGAAVLARDANRAETRDRAR